MFFMAITLIKQFHSIAKLRKKFGLKQIAIS